MADGIHGKAVFLGKGKTAGKYPLVIARKANIPFLLNVPGMGHRIDGEVYSVDKQLLQFLDEFEGCPDMYQRSVERIEMVKLEKKGDLPEDRQENLSFIDTFIYSTTSYEPEWLNLPYHDCYDSFGEHGLTYHNHLDK
uniref:Gamma-glutamylaminecyclotransferase n=1 Tax=Leptobrachium leishanense TaxID=445787 RepID=A0A8C5LSV4_9ANUR